jgi:TolB-like protein/Tfp pilus assembly protein PilF
MASIHPNYEYDIFISYRQNDNKSATAGRYDGWVTEFVDNLQKELDATLKNSVSIYFDENPHDGLQDSHLVDESLKKKLKCLIFIPILSQTYCDETSFAWQHEFLAFNEMAKADALGMNITLASGNVASRILPVQIHELETNDQSLLESILGPLRSIKFIYQNSGVNRPLRIKDADLADNINKTNYRNQINKVANALKDIGNSITRKRETAVKSEPPKVELSHLPEASTQSSKKGLYIGLTAIILLFLAYWGFTKFFSPSEKEVAELLIKDKTIAILPFSNTKPDPDTDFLGFAIANQIIGDLDYNKNLIVRPASSIRQYDQRVFDAVVVADDLKVNYVLTGTYLMQENIIRLNIEFLDVNNNTMVWRDDIEVDYHNAFELQDMVAKKVVDGLNAQFSKKEESLITKDIPGNPLAYEYYLRSLSYPLTNKGDELAIKMLSQSIALDSNFASAYSELGDRSRRLAVFSIGMPSESEIIENYYKKALSLNENLISALSGLSELYTETARTEKAVEISRRILMLNPNNANAHFSLGYIYRYAGMGLESIEEMEKAIAIDPGNKKFRSIGVSYYRTGAFEKAITAFDIDKGTPFSLGWQGYVSFRIGNHKEAIKYFDRAIAMDPEGFWGLFSLQYKELILGNTENALAILRRLAGDLSANDGEMLYYYASEYSLLGDRNMAILAFQKAVNNGYFDYPYMLTDTFLDPIRQDPEFQKILAQAKEKHEAFKEKFF